MFARIRTNPSLPAVATGAALVGTVAYGARRYYTPRPIALDSAPGFKSGSPPTRAFDGFLPVAFRTLTLQSAELVNHNTRKLTFRLPEGAQVSGLGLTCTVNSIFRIHGLCTDFLAAALLSIHVPKGGLLPVVRPYTPISNLSKSRYLPPMRSIHANSKV